MYKFKQDLRRFKRFFYPQITSFLSDSEHKFVKKADRCVISRAWRESFSFQAADFEGVLCRESESLECCPNWFYHRSLQGCLSASLAVLTWWQWTHHGTTWVHVGSVREFGGRGIWTQPLNYWRHNIPNNIMHLCLLSDASCLPIP